MNFEHYVVMGLKPQYPIDPVELDQAYRKAMRSVHPDRFIGADLGTQRSAAEQTLKVQQAYQILKDPLQAACYYIIERFGQPENQTVSPAFLMEQLDWQERLADPKTKPAALTALALQRTQWHNDLIQALETNNRTYAHQAYHTAAYWRRLWQHLEGTP